MQNARSEETANSTASQILDVAERLAQTRGYNGFSYADIAAEVGITKASLHYHFKTKSDLGRRLIERYSVSFGAALADIEAGPAPALDKLAAYARLYAQVLRAERLCLCGMLAAEYSSLPEPMQEEIRGFFDMNEVWLARIMEAGRQRGELRFEGEASEMARLLLGSLEGAMLVARPYADSGRFDASVQPLLSDLAAS
jgi:TetR/AcrR family transcriptional repressor of nem operon